jgi:hypothetical protein
MNEQITSGTASLWTGLTAAFTGFMHFIPSLLGAAVILMVGWFISKFIGTVVERVLVKLKVNEFAETSSLSGIFPQRPNVCRFFGTMAKWFVFLIVVQASVITLGIPQITGITNSIILFIPNIFVAAVILLAGAWASKYFSTMVEKTTSSTLGLMTRYGILGFAVIAAVSQLGIATNLINILFTGLVASLALAFGLAFGLGGRSAASDITKSLMGKSRSYIGSPMQTRVDEELNH